MSDDTKIQMLDKQQAVQELRLQVIQEKIDHIEEGQDVMRQQLVDLVGAKTATKQQLEVLSVKVQSVGDAVTNLNSLLKGPKEKDGSSHWKVGGAGVGGGAVLAIILEVFLKSQGITITATPGGQQTQSPPAITTTIDK